MIILQALKINAAPFKRCGKNKIQPRASKEAGPLIINLHTMKIKISKNAKIDYKQLMNLYVSLEWGKNSDYTKSVLKKMIKKPCAVYSAWEGKRLIGIARVFSDSVVHTYVPDIVVLPAYQKMGIGRNLLKNIINDFNGTGIFLEALEETESFFSACGFKKKNLTVLTYGSNN